VWSYRASGFVHFIFGGDDVVEKYIKLVRDKIPEIIKQQGDLPKTELLDEDKYINVLNAKLMEEVAEYLENYNVYEFADILEVIYAIAKYKGITQKDLEDIRVKKLDERGGFDSRISLIEVKRGRNE
jgi:predicted house-cleaning noncanonical NTP pyrophosphatase (MazG superfamily)